ncbi:MAG: hypothetical protein E6Q78_12850 [Rhodoferax sp.]|nr:MAG: hypothetical protein E6Q78_12850 [Rhodoferax sp.]
MDTAVIIGLAVAVLCAAGVYVVMEYLHFGERQKVGNQLLKHQTEAAAVRKELEGYTKYATYLGAAKTHLVDNAKSLQVKVVREYTYAETFNRDAKTLKAPVTILQRYNVEAQFSFDLKAGSFELIAAPTALEVHMHGKPSLQGIANARPVAHEITNEGVLDNEPVAVKQIQQKLIAIAQKQAEAIGAEDATTVLCERKVADALRSLLITQAGVRQVPYIAFLYK